MADPPAETSTVQATPKVDHTFDSLLKFGDSIEVSVRRTVVDVGAV